MLEGYRYVVVVGSSVQLLALAGRGQISLGVVRRTIIALTCLYSPLSHQHISLVNTNSIDQTHHHSLECYTPARAYYQVNRIIKVNLKHKTILSI